MTKPSPYNDKQYKAAKRRLHGQPCVDCGNIADTVDHIRPIDTFPPGTPLNVVNAPDNLQPMCIRCNSRRGAQYRNRKHARKSWRNKTYTPKRLPTPSQ